MPNEIARSFDLTDGDDEAHDRELEVYAKAVAEFKVTWQRQKKEKERKFTKTAQIQLDEHLDRKQREVQEIMKDMEETYQEFLTKYAAIEDKMRQVLVEIIDKQKTLVALSVRKHQETIERTSDLEESQLEGINQIKQSCQDFADMMDAFMKVDA